MRARAALYAIADGRMAAGGFTPSHGFEAAGITDLSGLRMHLLGRLYGSLRADRAIATETCRLGPASFDRLAWEADVRATSVSQRELARSRGQMFLRFGRRMFTDAGVMLPDELPEPVAIGALAWLAQAHPVEADALTLYTGIAGPVWTAVRILSLDPTDAASLIVDLCAAAPPPALPATSRRRPARSATSATSSTPAARSGAAPTGWATAWATAWVHPTRMTRPAPSERPSSRAILQPRPARDLPQRCRHPKALMVAAGRPRPGQGDPANATRPTRPAQYVTAQPTMKPLSPHERLERRQHEEDIREANTLIAVPHRKRASLVACPGAFAIGLAMFLALIPQPALAADLHVPGTFPTIQAALDAAAPGDTVLVDPGTYTENLDFHGKDVRVQSTGGAAVTTINGAGRKAVSIGPAGALVGFTVTGALDFFGAAMEVFGAGTLVQGNVFDGNTQQAGGFGAAIGGNVASPTVDGNLFRNNSCDTQFLSGVVAFVNGSAPRITNNVFAHNPCRAINMVLPAEAAPVVVDNTVVDNPVGLYVSSFGSDVYRNNVVVGNQVGYQFAGGNPPVLENNLVFGNGTNYLDIADQTGTNGNISADPLFVDAGQDDYHLRAGSPAIDAGTALTAPGTDFDGNPRPVDGDGDGTATVDIGAFEAPSASVRSVGIDIRPKSTTNRISLRRDRTVQVAVLSAAGFDAPTVVDRTSLTFGRTGDEHSLVGCAKNAMDVNGDGRRDLVCGFSVQQAGFQLGDTVGILRGRTVSGQAIEGRDSVQIVS